MVYERSLNEGNEGFRKGLKLEIYKFRNPKRAASGCLSYRSWCNVKLTDDTHRCRLPKAQLELAKDRP